MMCASASRRTPTMPTGFLIPPCWSTMNSCGMTWRTSRSMGMTIAFAASITRSTSSLVISLSLPVTATTPRELMPSMCPPATPVYTPCTSRPDMSSADSTAFWMDFTVDSMLITTPRRRPRDGVVPDTDDLQLSRLVELADDGADLRRADVQPDNEFRGSSHRPIPPSPKRPHRPRVPRLARRPRRSARRACTPRPRS